MRGVIALALALALPPTAVRSQTEEWTCPAADKVALLARAPGWLSADTVSYPFQAPKHRFARMRSNPLGGAECFYRIEGGGLLRIFKYGKCETGKGKWQAVGNARSCETANPDDCSLRCVPKE
jgi:hypothetical protein